ncbi:hypothetical protein AGMMS49545_20600 [Betaproteobacteria bacterium]|nr:hypothetical protein AGMMS49545_20600 [Betaproteobacteria bacterium]GHU39755.1 hypothetical protein AGMMS50289_00020 [Betaproteobacteria bacterium]
MNVKNRIKTLGRYGYAGFCLLWIYMLTLHPYEWMLEPPDSEFTALCQLPPQKLTLTEMSLLAAFCLVPLVIAGGLEWRKRGKPTRILLIAGVLLAFGLFRLSRFGCLAT